MEAIRIPFLSILSILSLLPFLSLATPRAVPQVLLVQIKVPDIDGENPNVPIVHFLAEELEEVGRVLPVAWGMADPLFRAAVEDRIIKDPVEFPSLQQAQQAASQLKADYLFVITAWRVGPKLRTKAQLYRKGSLVWSDPKPGNELDTASEKNRKVAEKIAKQQKTPPPPPDDEEKPEPGVRVITLQSIAEFSAENASRSLAHTYAQLLNGDPFRSHPSRPKQNTPEPDTGANPIVIQPLPIRTVDNAGVLAEVDELLGKGQTDTALMRLRDAIDIAPLEGELRRRLVRILWETGQAPSAAAEARRALRLSPDDQGMRSLAVRAWIDAGMLAEANAEVNEALARNSDDPAVIALSGEMKLLSGEGAAAVALLNKAIDKGVSAHFARAVAHACAGNAEAAKADLAASDKTPGADKESASRYRLIRMVAGRTCDEAGATTRELIQRARLNRRAPEHGNEAEVLIKRTDALGDLLAAMTPPEKNKNSHQQAILALKLLSQSISDLQSYLKSGEEETLNEATINLGQAIKNLSAAAALQKAEG